MAIAHVASIASSLGPSGGVTGAIDTTGATLIIVGVAHYATITTVSDNKSNTYTALTLYTGTDSSNFRFYYCLSPNVGSGHTVSVGGSGIYAAAVVYAFSGANTYDSQINGSNSASSPLNVGSVTPSVNGALVFTGYEGDGTTATPSTPAGFTGRVTAAGVGAISLGISGAYLIQGTAAAVNPAWTWTGTHTSATGSVAVFKESIPPPTTGTVTQFVTEIISYPIPTALTTQFAVEILSETTPSVIPSAEVTQFLIVMP